MAEYIEREETLNELCMRSEATFSLTGKPILDVNYVEAIKAVPAAAVRPVVLCMDCKFAPIGDRDGDDLEWPNNEYDGNPCPYKCSDNWYSRKPAPDFFCAAGENREES